MVRHRQRGGRLAGADDHAVKEGPERHERQLHHQMMACLVATCPWQGKWPCPGADVPRHLVRASSAG